MINAHSAVEIIDLADKSAKISLVAGSHSLTFVISLVGAVIMICVMLSSTLFFTAFTRLLEG